MMRELIERTAEVIVERGNVVAFSGAGVSKESGIPTFRDPGGLWDRFESGSGGGIMGVLSANPDKAVDIMEELFKTFEQAQPNPGHHALAELERLGLLRSVITQNIDNLHREAGNTEVYELHGSVYRLRCLSCHRRIPRERCEFLDDFASMIAEMRDKGVRDFSSLLRTCDCGGMLRPDFVAFGEPVQELQSSITAASECRVMLILGTSGVVYPAASMPGYAQEAGAVIIEINPKPSALTPIAEFFLEGPTGEVLPNVIDEVKRRLQ
jgi:NAD-dependent deacetylase